MRERRLLQLTLARLAVRVDNSPARPAVLGAPLAACSPGTPVSLSILRLTGVLMTRYGCKRTCTLLMFCSAISISAHSQTFTTLFNFGGSNGSFANGSLVQGRDANVYGTTVFGGRGGSSCSQSGCGTVFKVDANGALTNYSFCIQKGCPDGAWPNAGLLLSNDGSFYGVTSLGGAGDCGTVFKITAIAALTTLHTFDDAHGCRADAELFRGTDEHFYGTTFGGGNNQGGCGGGVGCGTLFRTNSQGSLEAVYLFCSAANCSDGDNPLAGVVQGSDGDFYGTTSGMYMSAGTIFKLSKDGTLSTLYTFHDCGDGMRPLSGLVQGKDGDFYGTTSGASFCPGTVFKITPQGALTTLYYFCAQTNCTDGQFPYGGLIEGTDGNFYGETNEGGGLGGESCYSHGCGTVFRITPGGVLTTLHSFDYTDGANPVGKLLQATDGSLYGTTQTGGANGGGTVFRISTGLGPFVAFVQNAGRVGQTGGILGQGFTGATSVAINGTPANFQILSDTYLTATVPPGATSGYVTVTTPGGELKSNAPFRVVR